MNEPIFRRGLMRDRGIAAFHANKGREDHEMNPGAAAIEDWQLGWDEAADDCSHAVDESTDEAAA